MLKDIPEQKLKPEFEKYAGKIVNLAELDALREVKTETTWQQRLASALAAPVRGFRDLVESFRTKPALDSAKFYITKEAQAAYTAAHPNGDIIPDSTAVATRAASYFEVSQLLAVVSAYGSPSSLTKEFMKAVDAAADHRAELGNLVPSGYAVGIGPVTSEPRLSAVALSKDTVSYASFSKARRS